MLAVPCILTTLVAMVMAAPQNLADSQDAAAQIVSQDSAVSADGTFNHSFETSNGIRIQESGFVKPGVGVSSRLGSDGTDDGNGGDAQVIQGSFSYTAPDGSPISLTYTADESGFHPEGSHLPTPPPIPEAIQRSLELLPASGSQDFGTSK